MSEAWAICVPAEKLAASGGIRLRPRILVAIIDGTAWLRGAELTDELDHALRLLRGAVRYHLAAGGALIPPGLRIPIGKLPELEWKSLADLLVFHPQPPALPGQLGQKAPLRLERGGMERLRIRADRRFRGLAAICPIGAAGAPPSAQLCSFRRRPHRDPGNAASANRRGTLCGRSGNRDAVRIANGPPNRSPDSP